MDFAACRIAEHLTEEHHAEDHHAVDDQHEHKFEDLAEADSTSLSRSQSEEVALPWEERDQTEEQHTKTQNRSQNLLH